MTTKKNKKNIKKKKKVSSETTSSVHIKRRDYYPIIFLGLLLIGLIYMVSVQSAYVDFGLDRDEGTYINLGEVLRDGGEMYKDVYSMKPPAIFYSYAAFNTLFGYSGGGLRWSLIIMNAIAALLLFFVGYKWKGPLFGFVSALSYSLFSFNPFVFGFAALAEQYQNVLTIIALVVLQQGITKHKWFLFALGGAILTYSTFFKQNAIFVQVALSVGIFWYYLLESKTSAWKPILYYVGGCLITAVIIMLPVVIQGNFNDWIYWNFTYSSLYTSSIPWEKGQEYLASFFKFTTRFNIWMWVAGALGVIISAIKIKSIAGKIAIVLFFIASILSIFPGSRFYPHYWIYFSPILAVGCGWTFFFLADLLAPKIKLKWSRVLSTVLFLGGLGYVYQQNEVFFNSPNELYINRRMYGDNPFTETRILGEHLKKRIQKKDEVLLLGSEPQFLTYVGKSMPTPYMFFAHLTKPHERQPSMVQDLQNWAETTKPKYVYFSNHPYSWVMSQGADQAVYHWGSNYVRTNHKVIAVADILPGQAPKIVLGDQAATYQTQSQKWVKIYERIGE